MIPGFYVFHNTHLSRPVYSVWLALALSVGDGVHVVEGATPSSQPPHQRKSTMEDLLYN